MRRVHLVRAALTAALLTSSPPSRPRRRSAGGPTSALLSIPGAGSTALLYYTDPEYDELLRPRRCQTSRAARSTARSRRSTSTAPASPSPGWSTTSSHGGWTASTWAGKDGPWISTQVSDFSGGTIWDSPVLLAPPPERRAADEPARGDWGWGTAASKNTDFEGRRRRRGARQEHDGRAPPAGQARTGRRHRARGWFGRRRLGRSAGWSGARC